MDFVAGVSGWGFAAKVGHKTAARSYLGKLPKRFIALAELPWRYLAPHAKATSAPKNACDWQAIRGWDCFRMRATRPYGNVFRAGPERC